jgi:hypothetical protein
MRAYRLPSRILYIVHHPIRENIDSNELYEAALLVPIRVGLDTQPNWKTPNADFQTYI